MEEDEELDLSSWFGKAPPKPDGRSEDGTEGDKDHDVEMRDDSVLDNDSGKETNDGDIQESGAYARDGSEDSETSYDAVTAADTAKLSSEQLIYIEVPEISDKDEYEYLPGHYSVERVYQSFGDDQYLVKLQSGEKDLFTSKQLRRLKNGSSALKDFLSNKMTSRNRRTTHTPQRSGMVNWALLDISESDDPIELDSSSKNKRQGKRSSNYGTRSDGESKPSTGDEEFDSDNSQPMARRSGRIKLKTSEYYPRADHDDNSDDSDSGGLSRRLRKRKAQQPLAPKGPQKRLSRQRTGEVARRSERTRELPRRDMRERQEDEISVNSEEEVGPKVVATKEYFTRIAEHDPFRRRHRQDCDTCNLKGDSNAKGPLVFCQGCSNSYHKLCLGPRGSREHLVTKVGENNFVLQCRRCLGMAHKKDHTAPDHGVCTGCKERGKDSKPFRKRLTNRQEQLQREEMGGRDPVTIVDASLIGATANVMFRCVYCQRAWHMHHLPKRSAENHPGEPDDDELDEEELAQRRFDAYHRAWTCKDCVEQQSQIDALVAWRPLDVEAYIPGCTVDMMEEVEIEYLVKWRAQSHFRTTWMPGSWVWGVCPGVMRASFMKKEENKLPKMRTEDAIPEDFLRVDIVFDVRYTSVVRNRVKEIDMARVKEVDSAYVKYKGLGYEEAIWEKPPSVADSERWNDFKAAYEEWVMKHYVSIPVQSSLRRHLIAIRTQDFESTLVRKEQPSSVTGGKMMEYQMEGLNWLYYQWFKSQNAILADEMGLGKTIQLIALFALLVQDHKCWPFLVVVPNSTCPNWRREIRKWVPSLRVVTYYGSAAARKLAHDFELFPKDEDDKENKKGTQHKKHEVKDIKAHVVVASYESIVEEKTRKSLSKVPWQGLVVDEGQRLKNDKNLLYDALSRMRFPFKVLLTGTPLQNHARELFNLLQFLDRKIDASALEAKYENLTKENVPELHELIRPFFLRRTKIQVLTFLPPVAQIILPVTMSIVQKKVYKSILAKNPQLLKSIFSRDGALGQKEKHNLNNILMQLRKTCCHPFVYSKEIEERSHELAVSHRNLVEASSKLQLFQIMLPKLQERGHRVLIFSQFLENLDIVEDFLDGLGMQHRRLDGTINSMEKQKRIDEFNAPDSPYFAFLLSTRSGGVGINLATADTVIIMDPDFNPHQDIQALSRAHRIGQKNKVLVFQIMTRGSVEEKIMQIGKKKMVLDHVLIQQMDHEDEAGIDLESILRHGAEALFNDEDETDNEIRYDSASVDKLLDRSQIENTSSGDDKSAESQFSFARIWVNDKAILEQEVADSGPSTPNPTVWDKILKERERAYAEEAALKAETLGRGKRRRQNVDYATQDAADQELFGTPLKVRAPLDGSDTDFQAMAAESDENETGGEEADFNPREEVGPEGFKPARVRPTVKARPFTRVKVPSGPAPHFNGDGPADYIPLGGLPPTHLCSACHEVHPMGWCRLKLAGVEHCGLCGLAHAGHGRTCPHLNSEVQVATLLGTLKESTESRELVDQATKYLRMIRGDLVQRKRAHENRQLEQLINPPTHRTLEHPRPTVLPARPNSNENYNSYSAGQANASMQSQTHQQGTQRGLQ